MTGIAALVTTAQAATNLHITAFSNGILTWTNVDTSLFYTVEWKQSLTATNSWLGGYTSLQDVKSTSDTISATVPVFYRVWGCSNRVRFPALVPHSGQTNSWAKQDDRDWATNGIGTPWPVPRFADHGDGTVTDNLTGLMWSKDARLAGGQIGPWTNAIAFCDSLSLGGYSDWRMPNIRELFTLVDFSQSYPALPSDHPFQNVRTFYWASTTVAGSDNDTWLLIISDGRVDDGGSKTGTLDLWPVRGGHPLD
jgi:hypothetical protein